MTVRPFQGSGNVLGSIAPEVAGGATPGAAAGSATSGGPKKSEADAQKEIGVDTSAPMTTLQVRLADGGRLVVKLNHTNTVNDLRRYIQLVRPEFTTFSLHTTFPNKELTNDEATLKDADVLGAAVLMRSK